MACGRLCGAVGCLLSTTTSIVHQCLWSWFCALFIPFVSSVLHFQLHSCPASSADLSHFFVQACTCLFTLLLCEYVSWILFSSYLVYYHPVLHLLTLTWLGLPLPFSSKHLVLHCCLIEPSSVILIITSSATCTAPAPQLLPLLPP